MSGARYHRVSICGSFENFKAGWYISRMEHIPFVSKHRVFESYIISVLSEEDNVHPCNVCFESSEARTDSQFVA